MTVFRISPQLFFFIGLSPAIFSGAAVYIVKASGGIKFSLKHELKKLIFYAYLLILASITLFPVRYSVSLLGPVFRPSPVNLFPLKTIIQAIGVLGISEFSFLFKLKTIISVIFKYLLLFMPIGFFLPQLHKWFQTAVPCLLTALVLSCCFEVTGYIEASFDLASNRTANIDNVLLAVTGAFIGFRIWRRLCRNCS